MPFPSRSEADNLTGLPVLNEVNSVIDFMIGIKKA